MDELTFTLNSPLTESDWDVITDVNFEHTDQICFHCKNGKKVCFVNENRLEELGACVAIPEEVLACRTINDDELLSMITLSLSKKLMEVLDPYITIKTEEDRMHMLRIMNGYLTVLKPVKEEIK